jgi:hypothetical protein
MRVTPLSVLVLVVILADLAFRFVLHVNASLMHATDLIEVVVILYWWWKARPRRRRSHNHRIGPDMGE